MSFFISILKNNNLPSHDGRPVWKYALSDQEYLNLIKVLQYSDPFNIDPRDACIYYAEWWKREFNGGKPGKESVFEKLNGNILNFYYCRFTPVITLFTSIRPFKFLLL